MTTHRPYPLIDAVANLQAHFREEMDRALDALAVQTLDDTRAYIVHMLDGFVRMQPHHRAQLGFERPAALLLGDAVHGPGEQRIEAYRQLGDSCLYSCGFFQERLVRRGVRLEYYTRIGRTAYLRLAEWMAWKQPGGSLARTIGSNLRASSP